MTELGLVIVGGGKMGEALLSGLLKAGKYKPADVLVIEPLTERRAFLAERYKVKTETGINHSAIPSYMVGQLPNTILATKPNVIPVVAAAAARHSNCILSIAAGVTIATIERAVSNEDTLMPIIRAMPNTPALVGQGAAAICGNDHAASYLDWAEEVLSAVGTVVRTTEAELDAVTGLSGSGPAYVFLVAEAMIDAGVAAGLTRQVATELTTQTLLGSATLLREGISEGTQAADLRANVTSPGGTTAAGLRELEKHSVRAAFASAVEAATQRSAQLGRATAPPAN